MAIKAIVESIAEEYTTKDPFVVRNKIIGLRAYDSTDAKKVFEFTQNSVLTGKGISITPDGILTVPNASSNPGSSITGRISVIDTKTGTEYKTADNTSLASISVGSEYTLT